MRINRIESTNDDHRKELAILRDRVMAIEKIISGSVDILSLKSDLDMLKKELASLRSIDLSTYFDGLEDLPFKVDVAAILDERLSIDVLGDGSEENQVVGTPKIDEKTFGAEQSQEEQEEFDGVENKIVEVMKAPSILDQSMIGKFDVSDLEFVRPDTDLKSTQI